MNTNGIIASTIAFFVLAIPVIANITSIIDNVSKFVSFIRSKISKRTQSYRNESKSVSNNMPKGDYFVGRSDQKKRIIESISEFPITAIVGQAGIGKTALALNIVHSIMNKDTLIKGKKDIPRFNAFVWVSAKDDELNAEKILDTIARVLDYPYITQKSYDDKFGESIKLLSNSSILLVIDNFETITDKRLEAFFHNLPQHNRILITTRYKLNMDAQYNLIDIESLGETDGYSLLEHELTRLNIRFEKAEARSYIAVYMMLLVDRLLQ